MFAFEQFCGSRVNVCGCVDVFASGSVTAWPAGTNARQLPSARPVAVQFEPFETTLTVSSTALPAPSRSRRTVTLPERGRSPASNTLFLFVSQKTWPLAELVQLKGR